MSSKFKNAIVIGSNAISKELIQSKLNVQESCNTIILADESQIQVNLNINFYYGLNSIKDILSTSKIDSVFYCFESYNKQQLLSIAMICRDNKLNLYIASRKEAVAKKSFLDLRDINLLFLSKSKSSLLIKRMFDIIVSSMVIVILLPIFCIISILIPIESGFPILFKQNRVGNQRKIFSMYKFRSLYNSSNHNEESPSDSNDKRITKIGRYIRKTSLDELPQFFNVLKGDMSIVGPRPEMEFIVSKYNEFEKLRLNSQPGITGFWQLSDTRNQPIHFNIDYDLSYMSRNSSIISDLFYIIKTVFFSSRGI